jgi:hypothetical protein
MMFRYSVAGARHAPVPCCPTMRHLFIRNQNVDLACVQIDAQTVAGSQQCQIAAHGGFR